jgi:acetyl-CoA carboxylase biotin carboxylase subunit
MTDIRTLLVANRGEIARRVFRTCRALGIGTVAVFSDADADAPHVAEADQAVRLGEAASSASYLNVEAVLEAARISGANAIHPGYGFLSENATFARRVQEAGLIWVGPPPAAIEAMGDKAAARKAAVAQGVPVVPGYDGDDDSEARLIVEAEKIGVPLLIKAVAGGGGRGMRRVDDLADLPEALASARREAAAAFGNDRVVLERYVWRPRHIEVQVFGDQHGRVVHLGERECSIQRRHQKIFEEAPSPAVDAALRARLGAAAVRVALAVDYVGAGTIEFLLDQEGNFYFLEMNTRLQVEHPVTEEVTGQDLVAWQITVAEGRPLPLTQEQVSLCGHAIEVRVYAEDPNRDYLPGTGRLIRVDLPREQGVRIDGGYETGGVVGIHYDAMLAKVIVSGADRREACRRLRRAVEQAWVPGVITNLPLLRDIADDEAWLAGDLDTGFLGRRGLPRPPPVHLQEGAVVAAALSWWSRREDRAVPGVAAGWRLDGPAEERDRWSFLGEEVEVGTTDLGGAVLVRVGDTKERVQVLSVDGDRVRLRIGDRVQAVRWARDRGDGPVLDGTTLYLHLGHGEAMVTLVPRFPPPAVAEAEPGSCMAPTPAVVRKLYVAVGDEVAEGAPLVVLEAMKMEQTLRAPFAGTVASVAVAEGEAVEQGTLLVRIEATA